MADIFRILGGVAGVGGLALGVLFLLYRDLTRDLIRRRMFQRLSAAQATALFGAVTVLTFSIAVLGLFAGLADGRGADRFLLLVVVLLVFITGAGLIAARYGLGPGAKSARTHPLAAVAELVERGRPAEAERELALAPLRRGSEEHWYWLARIAAARDNREVALRYVQEALAVEPRNEHSLALQIRLLLTGDAEERERAAELIARGRGISRELDTWLTRVDATALRFGGPPTGTELDTACPLPERATR